jgi:protein ImuB
MALFFPRLPTDRLMRSGVALPDGRPLVVYAKIKNAFTLTAVDKRATVAGLKIRMSLADARAIRPDLVAYEVDEAADAKLLDAVAAWCERFTPIVVPDPPQGLLLDITGCTHLFGGEAKLLEEVELRLTAQGFVTRAAIAPTPGAAWAFARTGKARLLDAGGLKEALSVLPVGALRLRPEATALLKRLGLKNIGQIMDSPRQPFAARAGQHALLRLDQALGETPEALTPRRKPPPLYVLRCLVEPILTMEAILIVAEVLCTDLCTQLEEMGAGVQFMRLSLFGVDNKTRTIQLGLSRPERDLKIMLRLLRERLSVSPEALDAEFGFDAMRLDAVEIASIILRPIDLAPVAGRDKEAEARLVDRLSARLGAARIGRPELRLVHAPERANDWAPANTIAVEPPKLPEDGVVRRPLRLFACAQPVEALASVPDGPPMRFRWRRILHEVKRAEGPERITPDWLRAPTGRTRDYYRVEDREGRRFWLYREGFHGEEPAPRWYLHGVFV